MGYPYDELVPVVILADNPGVTKEELAELYQKTNLYSGEIPYYSFASRSWDGDFKNVWRPFKKQKDATGFKVEGRHHTYTRAEQRAIIWKHNLAHWDNRDVFPRGERDAQNDSSFFPKFFRAEYIHQGLYGVGKILQCESHTLPWKFSICYAPGWPEKRGLIYAFEEERNLYRYFATLSELIKEYPPLAPENVFDFEKPFGSFDKLDDKVFTWYKRGERYYFDKENFVSTTNAGGDVLNQGYTDFIITQEAVRAGAWKLLTYRGLSHLENALKRFPQIKRAYEQAVVDAHTSLHAKAEKMTVNELLRLRLEGRMNEINRQTQRRIEECLMSQMQSD